MILPILAYGDPILKKEGVEIDKNYPELDQLIEDMFETMYEASGVGLAAPQIGKSIRLFVVDGRPFAEDEEDTDEKDPKAEGMENFKKVFINPIIEEESGEEWGFNEGCLSIPKIREEVFRKEKILVSYYNEKWELKEERFEGYSARIIQHEYDHLDGVLFTDHLSPLKKRLLTKKLQNISKGILHGDYKMKFPLLKKKR
ncbi:MAG: peptide deformylase [Crocinitomicaceae bacterium]|nr:peptide deformylase [Crocinitomicaceae bacterium]